MENKAFSINLNVQHVNGMTHFHLPVNSKVIEYSRISGTGTIFP